MTANDDLKGHSAVPGPMPSFSSALRRHDLIITSGHLGATPGGPEVPFGEQAELAFDRLVETVVAAGGSIQTILKVTAYLADLGDWRVWDELWRARLQFEPMPARTSVQAGLPQSALIELECIAYADDGS